MSSTGGFFDKVKDFVKGHPDQSRKGLDTLEEKANERTGGKYQEQLHQAGDRASEQLGLPGQREAAASGTSSTGGASDIDPSVPPPSPAPGPVNPDEPSTLPDEPAPGEPGTTPLLPGEPVPGDPGAPSPDPSRPPTGPSAL